VHHSHWRWSSGIL